MKIPSLLNPFGLHLDCSQSSSRSSFNRSSNHYYRSSKKSAGATIQPLSAQSEIAISVNAVAMIGRRRVSIADTLDPRLKAVVMLQKAKRKLMFSELVGGRSLAQDIGRRMPRFRLGSQVTTRQGFQCEAIYQLSKQVINDELKDQHSASNIKYALQKYDASLKRFDQRLSSVN